MDVLNSIPCELWREIFVMIPAPWIYGADRSSDPLCLFRSHEMDHEMIEDTQLQRLALMLVCKAMLPFAEELLYSEVYIGNPTSAERFIETARLIRAGRPSPGWWTRRISIKSTGWPLSLVARTFETLKDACPNITCMHTEQAYWGIHTSPGVKKTVPEYCSLLRDLRTLTVTGVDLEAEDITEIANGCPNLIHLNLHPETCFDNSFQPVTFPNLRRLSIDSSIIRRLVSTGAKISFRIEWLSVRVMLDVDIPLIHEFCHRYCSKLVGLDLSCDARYSRRTPYILPSNFLDFGSNLRTLILNSSFKMGSPEAFTPMVALNEIIVRLVEDGSNPRGREFAEYFAPSRFPRVGKILLVLLRWRSFDDRVLCDWIGGLMPGVEVEHVLTYKPDYVD